MRCFTDKNIIKKGSLLVLRRNCTQIAVMMTPVTFGEKKFFFWFWSHSLLLKKQTNPHILTWNHGINQLWAESVQGECGQATLFIHVRQGWSWNYPCNKVMMGVKSIKRSEKNSPSLFQSEVYTTTFLDRRLK